jgi:O-antigen/teichoic acid export membrane protein
MDIVIVKATIGGEMAGWYAGAANLALVPGFLGMALLPVILSTVSMERRQRGIASAAQKASGWIRLGCLALPLVAIAALLSPEITEVVLGEAFGPAAAILPLLLIACAGRVWIALGTAFLAGLDMAFLAARFAIAYLIAAPIAVVSGLWISGPVGAAAGYAIVAWLGVACFMAVLMTIRTVSIPWLSATRSLAVIVVVTLIGSMLTGEGLVFLASKALLLFVVAALVFVMTGERSRADRQMIQRSLHGSNIPPTFEEATSPLVPEPQPEIAK